MKEENKAREGLLSRRHLLLWSSEIKGKGGKVDIEGTPRNEGRAGDCYGLQDC